MPHCFEHCRLHKVYQKCILSSTALKDCAIVPAADSSVPQQYHKERNLPTASVIYETHMDKILKLTLKSRFKNIVTT